MKLYILIFATLFLFSCADNPVSLGPVNSSFTGHYLLELSGDLQGAATIVVFQNAKLGNGVILNYYDSIPVIHYFDSFVKNDGGFNSNFYCEKTLYTETDTLEFISKSGTFTGTFSNDSASGFWDVTLTNDSSFTGSWSAVKL